MTSKALVGFGCQAAGLDRPIVAPCGCGLIGNRTAAVIGFTKAIGDTEAGVACKPEMESSDYLSV